MENVFVKSELIRQLSEAVKGLINNESLIFKKNDSYNVNIVFNKNEIRIETSEHRSDNTPEMLLAQIGLLKEEITKLKAASSENDKRLNYQPITEIPEMSGWTVIQCRKSGRLDFITESYLYNVGFGDPNDEYWIGCEKLHNITKNRRHELHIAFEDSDGSKTYAHYDNFLVGSLQERYSLKSLGKYSGTAGDGLRAHEHQSFEFYNNWKGVYKSFSWWTAPSYNCNLNGNYKLKTNYDPEGFWWSGLSRIKYCKMSIRPKMLQCD